VRDAPGGFVIAYLRRGTVVRTLRRSASGRDTAMRLRSGTYGWVPSRALCRRRR